MYDGDVSCFAYMPKLNNKCQSWCTITFAFYHWKKNIIANNYVSLSKVKSKESGGNRNSYRLIMWFIWWMWGNIAECLPNLY